MASEKEPRARGFYWVRFVGQSESEVALWNGRWWYQNGVSTPAAEAEVEAVGLGPLEEVIAGMTKKEATVIDRARELIRASDGRSLYLEPGARIDVDVMLYAALSRAVVELRTERGEPRFAEKTAQTSGCSKHPKAEPTQEGACPDCWAELGDSRYGKR